MLKPKEPPFSHSLAMSDWRSKERRSSGRPVLKKGLKNLGTSLGTGKANFYSVASRQGRNTDELNVFRRTDLPCPNCGTNVLWSLEMRPDHMGVSYGCFEGPVPDPIRAIWTEDQHDWVQFPEDWPTYAKGSPS